MCPVNIFTYNVRGLGRGIKWTAIRRLVKKHKVDLLCLPETKKQQIDTKMCQSLWGDNDVTWELQPAINTTGGLLCLWSEESFNVERRVSGRGFILLEGVWRKEAQKVFIVNIYAPCDSHNKRILWESLKQIKDQNPRSLWCMLGDFNSVRNASERVGISQRGVDDTPINDFNEWLDDVEVIEPPCIGSKYTWFRPNGTAISKLDRAFISPE